MKASEYIQKKTRLEVAVACHRGRIRSTNQDNLILNNDILPLNHENNIFWTKDILYGMNSPVLAGVFDGMGGMARGELASFQVALQFRDAIKVYHQHGLQGVNWFKEVCFKINNEIFRECISQRQKIGSTGAMILFQGDEIVTCNLGDSPIYCFRNNRLVPLFEEHTDRKLYERLNISNSEKTKKYSLTQYFGVDPEEMTIVPYVSQWCAQLGDVLLICSDGLTDMVPEKQIQDILNRKYSVAKAVKVLEELALKNGGKDNITIICLKIKCQNNRFPLYRIKNGIKTMIGANRKGE